MMEETDDEARRTLRVHIFMETVIITEAGARLNEKHLYWKENIEAIIEEVTIAHGDHNPWDLQVTDDYRVLDFEKNI